MSGYQIAWEIAKGVIVALVVAYFNKKRDKRDKKQDKLEEARRKEALLSLELTMAAAKLSYATAMAMKRGTANGEVEEGIQAYNQAKDKYYAFLNEQAIEHLK